MKISIGVKNLTVYELIDVLDSIEADTSFLITDSENREFTFGELKKLEKTKE